MHDLQYCILRAYDGRCALEIARNERPDLILSDIMMPIMSGLDLCCHLQATPETAVIPVILMTAGRPPEQSCPAAPILRKPFDLATLEGAIFARLAEADRGHCSNGTAPA